MATLCEKCIHEEICYRDCHDDDDKRALTYCSEFKAKSDYVKRERGEWHLLDECANEGVYCSVCHKKVYRVNYANQKLKSNFCPNCGADMRKEQI